MRKLIALFLLLGSIALVPGCASVIAADSFGGQDPSTTLNLVNAGFEEAGEDGPKGWAEGSDLPGVEYVWDRNVAHSGEASLGFKKSQDRYFPIAGWSQSVKHVGSTSKLRVTCWVKAESTSKAILDVSYDGKEGWTHTWASYIGAVNDGDKPVSHDWKKYTGVVEIPAGATEIIIMPQMYGPGAVWFDDIEVEYVSDDTPNTIGGLEGVLEKTRVSRNTASVLNLENAGFELAGTDGPKGWAKGIDVPGVDYVWDRDVAHSGVASLRFTKTENRFFPIAGWSQTVKVKPSKLRVSCWVKASKVSKAVLDVGFTGSDGSTHEWVAYIGTQKAGDAPLDHDWKKYTGVVEVPVGTLNISIVPQMYGPGTVWFDDIEAEFVSDDTPTEVGGMKARSVSEVSSEITRAEGNRKMRYFLMGPKEDAEEPADGYRLLIVLPGGDGGRDFEPFVRRVYANSLGDDYLVAEAVAPKWSANQFEINVWPTTMRKWPDMEFSTEEFIESILTDVKSKHKVDSKYVFLLGWSSSGPAVYSSALSEETPVTGVFVAMSIYRPSFLPAESNGKGRAFYILHSAEDKVTSFSMAEIARDNLEENGANVEFKRYSGGHGWHGDVYGMIRTGVEWMEKQQG